MAAGEIEKKKKNRRILHSRVELEPFHPTMNLAFLCSRTEENMKVLSVFLILILRGEPQTIFFLLGVIVCALMTLNEYFTSTELLLAVEVFHYG